jgi:gluconolactonase
MTARLALPLAAALLSASVGSQGAGIPAAPADAPSGPPDAVLDLTTAEGVAVVQGQWRYGDTTLVEVDFRAAGPEGQPTGQPLKAYDLQPHAGWADFDDASWPVIEPGTLSARRTGGRLAFNWYRITLTLPERIGGFAVAGSTVVFETSLDDYAEVWVDGELPRRAGQSGGSMVKGWNAANRLVVARDVKPGRKLQLAVFGANGPLSQPPTNYVWMRSAKLDFYGDSVRGPYPVEPQEVNVEVLRLDPALDAIVPPNPKLHKLAEGFLFTEGPVWVREGAGYLLFSDPNANRIYKYAADGALSVFKEQSGHDAVDVAEYGQPGSNGLTLDRDGRLTVDEHGRRRVVRIEKDGRATVLADRFEGRRLNSPNDLVYRSDGALFFTDPPFGLPKFFEDRRKELAFSGVYALVAGKLRLATRELAGPNGIAFSPDEKYLYVGNWDEKKKVVMRYAVKADGTLADGRVFFDMTAARGEDAIDGIKVDEKGNLYVSGPGGLWILSPEGKHLGTILAPKHPHNFAWGDGDGKTLYLCARDRLYRMRLEVAGVRP